MRSMVRLFAMLGLVPLLQHQGVAMDTADLPAAPPRDAVMATADELRPMHAWAAAAFGAQPVPDALPLTVRRQDHSVLQFGRSTLDTPLRLGDRTYDRGLGTHAFSEIVVALPDGARRFVADVGIDHNDNTGGSRGSVVFVVSADGLELARTPVLRGGDGARALAVDLPEGARELVLAVEDGDDGVAHDQADWADARLTLADGTERYLDDGQLDTLLMGTAPPLSFVYDGRSSSELLPAWDRQVERDEDAVATRWRSTWTDPDTGLRVIAEAKAYRDWPAVDWTVHFENTGDADTPILEDIQALDTGLRTGYMMTPARIHQLRGDNVDVTSFQPFTTSLKGGETYRLAPTGGRPSSISAFPWWNVTYGEQGLICAVGWTGQWAASFDRAETGPTRLRAGMERTHLRLHPGERMRTPRIMIMAWQGDRWRAHAQWRRLLMHHVAPQHDDRPARLPMAMQCFDRYWQTPDWPTEAGQLAYAEVAQRLGADSLWLDAAWFPRMFPNGVGTWHADPERFPNGLKPISDWLHQRGMKFVLWFEPERVGADTQITNEHPEFVHGGAAGGLFKLDDPEARRWLTELLSRRIDEYGVDVYRNDFNLDPLDFWRRADADDRQGMTEIRYVEGLYAMWDELLARHPGLLIDNCSSGGRRLDLEMISRSVPLWRSDTGCWAGHPEWNQMQAPAVGMYLPLFTIGLWSVEPYEARSTATGGVPLEWGYRDPDFDEADARQTVAEIDRLRKYWYGDLYPLTRVDTEMDGFAAWQLHRADLEAGAVLAFRRPDCPLVGLIVGLRGLDPAATYRVTLTDDAREVTERTLTGRELQAQGLELRLSEPGSSLLVEYERQ